MTSSPGERSKTGGVFFSVFPRTNVLLPGWTDKAWNHVVFHVDFDASPVKLVASVRGASAVEGSVPRTSDGTVDVRVGARSANGTAANTVHADNVRITTE